MNIKKTIFSAILVGTVVASAIPAFADTTTFTTSTGGYGTATIDDNQGFLYGTYNNPTYSHRVNVMGRSTVHSNWKNAGTEASAHTTLALYGNKVTGSDR